MDGHSIYQYSKCIIFMIIHLQSFLDFQNIINDEYNIIMISPDVLIFPQISIIIIWPICVFSSRFQSFRREKFEICTKVNHNSQRGIFISEYTWDDFGKKLKYIFNKM